MRSSTSVAGLLSVTAALLYLGLPLEALTGFPLDPSRSYLSELAASDQATSPLFRVTDAAVGVLILAACALWWRGPGRRTALDRATLLALAGFAVGTIADVVFPMACAPSASAACAADEAAGRLGVVHQLHTVSSAAALAAMAVAAILLLCRAVAGLLALPTTAPAARPHARARLLATVVVAGLVIVVSAVVSAAATVGSVDGLLPDGGGLAQRLQTACISVLLAGLPLWTGWGAAPDARLSARRS